jgi:DNA-binding NtrC family response regulator
MTILAIDDDPSQLELLRTVCAALEYPPVEYLSSETAAGGLDLARERAIDLVITDLHLPESSGLEVLKHIRILNPFLPVVIMTAYGDTKEAVSLLKAGADDYLIKPTRRAEIERLILRANERSALYREAFLPPPEGPALSPLAAGIVYRSEAMARIMDIAARCANSRATILVSGESGTGKELIARFIHEHSKRSSKAFVAVNISALPESLMESELFGYRKGAFTGASADRVGRFEDADGGTLFLDEIGEVNLAIQVKLLRAIQFGVIERVGENLTRHLDVRIIAATNRDLASLVAEGLFRKDLYYRVNVIDIKIPPLRERKEDIQVLIDYFIRRFNERDGRAVKGLSREAFYQLMKHCFPGNVRELENIIEHAIVLSRGDIVRVSDLPFYGAADTEIEAEAPTSSYEEAMLQFERTLLAPALERAGGNQSKAARSLGISERHLRSRLLRLGLKS